MFVTPLTAVVHEAIKVSGVGGLAKMVSIVPIILLQTCSKFAKSN